MVNCTVGTWLARARGRRPAHDRPADAGQHQLSGSSHDALVDDDQGIFLGAGRSAGQAGRVDR
jgi:hypothetical protein